MCVRAVANQISAAGWSWGYTTHLDDSGETLFCVDAQRYDGTRYIVRSDELLTALLDLRRSHRDVLPAMYRCRAGARLRFH